MKDAVCCLSPADFWVLLEHTVHWLSEMALSYLHSKCNGGCAFRLLETYSLKGWRRTNYCPDYQQIGFLKNKRKRIPTEGTILGLLNGFDFTLWCNIKSQVCHRKFSSNHFSCKYDFVYTKMWLFSAHKIYHTWSKYVMMPGTHSLSTVSSLRCVLFLRCVQAFL